MSERKPRGFWKSLKNTIAEAKSIMKKEGWTILPQSNILQEKGYSSLGVAINHYHGGFYEFRVKQLGEPGIQLPAGTWFNLEFTIEQAKAAMEKEGWTELPSQQVLAQSGYTSLRAAISRYHGGFSNFRTKHLGQDELRVKNGHWKEIGVVIEKAKDAMKTEGWTTLPSQNELSSAGYGALIGAINLHGGLHIFRTKHLNQAPLQTQKGSWLDADFVVKQVKDMMDKEGWHTVPPETEMRRRGYNMIGIAITRHHGGLVEFREKYFAEQPTRVKNGLWLSLEFTIEQAKNIMALEKWDTLPSATVLRKKNYHGIVTAIYQYHGGFERFNEALAKSSGLPSEKEQLEGLLERYSDDAEE